jgi:cytochrome oxidase Cu insertion factor (SCO1/SenC/PrrC family)
MKYKIFSFCQVMSLTIACATLTARNLKAPSQTAIGGTNSASETVVNDFALTDQSGRPFHLSQLRGKVVLLFFGYTHCPDACPTTMAKLSRVYKLLGSDAERAMTLFVSVDPGRDTPSVLKGYLAYFHLNSLGLTGTKEEIDEVVKQYGAKYEIEQSDSAAGYHINHSTDLYLLNQKGEPVKTFSYSDGIQVIADGVRQVIR